MKPYADKEELDSDFTRLTETNRDYILAIARALAFAQCSNKEPADNPDNNADSI